jgi:hypothetical protein
MFPSMTRSYKEDNWGDQISSVQESVKRTRGCEAEESPLLEAVARERLVKTQQAWKGLASAVVLFEL